MLVPYEAVAQYHCQRHGEKDYAQESDYVDLVRRKHRHYDVPHKPKGGSRIVLIDNFLRVRRDQTSVVKQIKDALKHGNVVLARSLAMKGAQRYPAHHDLQEYSRLLAPPRIINRYVPSMPSIQANHNWLKAHRHKYQGHWVALHNGELIGVADSLDVLVNDIGQSKGTLLTKA